MTTRAQLERLLDEVQQSHLLRFADRLEPERLDGLLAQIKQHEFPARSYPTLPGLVAAVRAGLRACRKYLRRM